MIEEMRGRSRRSKIYTKTQMLYIPKITPSKESESHLEFTTLLFSRKHFRNLLTNWRTEWNWNYSCVMKICILVKVSLVLASSEFQKIFDFFLTFCFHWYIYNSPFEAFMLCDSFSTRRKLSGIEGIQCEAEYRFCSETSKPIITPTPCPFFADSLPYIFVVLNFLSFLRWKYLFVWLRMCEYRSNTATRKGPPCCTSSTSWICADI